MAHRTRSPLAFFLFSNHMQLRKLRIPVYARTDQSIPFLDGTNPFSRVSSPLITTQTKPCVPASKPGFPMRAKAVVASTLAIEGDRVFAKATGSFMDYTFFLTRWATVAFRVCDVRPSALRRPKAPREPRSKR